MKENVFLGRCMINIRKLTVHEDSPMDVLLLADLLTNIQEYLQRSIFYTST